MKTELRFVKLLDCWYIDIPEFSNILSLSDCMLIGSFDDFIKNITLEREVKLIASTEQNEESNIILTYLGNQQDKEIGLYEVKIINIDEVEYFGLVCLPMCIVNIFGEYPQNIFLCQ